MWTIFWAITILFSLITFTFMSAKVLYFGVGELKDMFKQLNKQKVKIDRK